MIRFYHSNYSSKELELFARLMRKMSLDIPCGEPECDDCKYKHICHDTTSLIKRIEYLNQEAKHNESI